MTTTEKESVLTRWSRRKQASSNYEKERMDEISAELPNEPDETALDNIENNDRVDIHSLTDDDMPDIETLNEESDYAGFLSKNVSEGLRKLALQKLFHSKTYHLCDGLDDYDGNYTVFEKLDASIITADMKHRLEMEAQRSLEEMASEEIDNEQDSERQVDVAEDEISDDAQLTKNAAGSETTTDETDNQDNNQDILTDEETA